jgi:hypothetical protein
MTAASAHFSESFFVCFSLQAPGRRKDLQQPYDGSAAAGTKARFPEAPGRAQRSARTLPVFLSFARIAGCVRQRLTVRGITMISAPRKIGSARRTDPQQGYSGRGSGQNIEVLNNTNWYTS